MTTITLPFVLNRKSGVLEVSYEPNQSAAQSGFDLFAGGGFDVDICIGYPTMRAQAQSCYSLTDRHGSSRIFLRCFLICVYPCSSVSYPSSS
jgi:hypothetical protein